MARKLTGQPNGRPPKTPLDRLEEAARAKREAEKVFVRQIPEAYRSGASIAGISKVCGLSRMTVYKRLRHAGFAIELPPPQLRAPTLPPRPGWEFEEEGEEVNGYPVLTVVESAPEPAEPVWVDRPVHR